MKLNSNFARKKLPLQTKATHTLSATSSPSSRAPGTNVKTATKTTAEVSTSASVDSYEGIIIKTNFIYSTSTSCASVSSPSSMFMPPHNKKITQPNYSTGMCETKSRKQAPTRTNNNTEVMLPLTSMSSKQITLTSRINVMGKDVGNKTEAALANETTKALPLLLQPSSTTTTTRKCLPILATSIAKSCRKQCLNIKMPLRHLILTIMAAVVLSMEFTICSSTSIMQHHLTTMSLPNSTHLPTTARANKSSKINDNLQNLPVTLTTLATTSSTTELFFASPAEHLLSAPSFVDTKTAVKSFESAALVESPSASSLMPLDDSSSHILSSLTGTATMAHTKTTVAQSSISYDADDGFSEAPTPILNKYDGSDLPPLSEAEQAAKDLLTKGFSIPTYLPPFPVFAVADLPAYLSTVSTTTTESPATHARSSESYEQNSLENLVYFDNMPDHQQQTERQHQHRKLKIPKRNSTMSSANVTVQVGNHAYLPCHLHRLQNKPVSWVRLRDGHIISVDQTTFIADQRFQAIFQDDKEFTWSLQIKYVQHTDEGWYECQASSEPKMSARVYLNVIVPLTELIGDQSRFVKAGSKVALHCIVRGTLDPPQYIIWYRDKTQIGEDNIMGWYTQLDRNIFGNSGDNQNTIGSLIIPFVRKMDSGNYTCQPSNSVSVSVDLHVLSGEYSASAIMSAARTCKLNDYYLLLLLFLLMLLHRT